MTTTQKITVPLLDLKAQYATIRDEVRAAMDEVIESQYFIMGPVVQALEKDIAEYCGVKHAIGCASGSDALLLALMAIGVKPGDEVICPAYTFFATAGSIARLGVKPVYADIDPVTYNMDPEHTHEIAKKCTRLKAIMPVHLYGQAVDLDAFLELGKRFNVPIIEDAAQAIGTLDNKGKPAGSRGTIGCFSFFPSKNLGGYGDGGIVTTNDDKLADLLGILRMHGSRPKYYHSHIGVNSRLDALQAAILRVKLHHLDSWHAARQRNAKLYDTLFTDAGAKDSRSFLMDGGLPLRTPATARPPARHIYNQYVIRVPEDQRDQLRDHLKEFGVGTEIYYPVPLHLQKCFDYLGYAEGDLPHSESAAKQTIALPIYPELTETQIRHVAQTIITWVKQHAAVA